MGTLYHIPIHTDPDGCMTYIADSSKIIPQRDTVRLMTYMQSHSAEEAESVGFNGCSHRKDKALLDFQLCEKLYNKKNPNKVEQKSTALVSVKQYLKLAGIFVKAQEHWPDDVLLSLLPDGVTPNEDGKIEIERRGITAQHFIYSLDKKDKCSPRRLRKIWKEFMSLPYMRDHFGYGNVHINTKNMHIHAVVSNFSKDGSKKLRVNLETVAQMKNDLDHICVKHGLSIIDDRELAYRFPEREAWIEELVKEGKVRVLIPANAERIKNPNRHQLWMLEQYRAGRVEMCEGESAQGKYKNPSPQKKQYAAHSIGFERKRLLLQRSPLVADKALVKDVLLYAEEKSLYVGSLIPYRLSPEKRRKYLDNRDYKKLYFCVSYYAGKRRKTDAEVKAEYNAKVLEALSSPDYEIQRQMDAIATCRKLNVRRPADLDKRVEEIGAALGQVRKDLKWQRSTLQNGDALADAIQTYQDHSASEIARNAAYRAMAAHKCTKPSDIEDFLKRRQAASQRLPELKKKEEELGRQYADAKRASMSLHVLEKNAGLQAYRRACAELDQTSQPASELHRSPAKREKEPER